MPYPSKPRHLGLKEAAARAESALRRQCHACAPLDGLEDADVGEEALPATVDEDLAAEAVPDAVEHEDAVIDIGDAAVLLDGRADQPRQDLHRVAEHHAEPAHEAALAQHILQAQPMVGHEKVVHRIERTHRRPLAPRRRRVCHRRARVAAIFEQIKNINDRGALARADRAVFPICTGYGGMLGAELTGRLPPAWRCGACIWAWRPPASSRMRTAVASSSGSSTRAQSSTAPDWSAAANSALCWLAA